MPKPKLQLYVVVCDGGHVAIGPADLKGAMKIAKAATLQAQDGCTFTPIPLALLGEVVEMEDKPKKQKKSTDKYWHGGQYL